MARTLGTCLHGTAALKPNSVEDEEVAAAARAQHSTENAVRRAAPPVPAPAQDPVPREQRHGNARCHRDPRVRVGERNQREAGEHHARRNVDDEARGEPRLHAEHSTNMYTDTVIENPQ